MEKRDIGIALIKVVILVCIVIFAKDILSLLNFNFGFVSNISTKRVSNSEYFKPMKYGSTDYVVENKEEIFGELKKYNDDLVATKELEEDIFEIKNIHKLKDYYLEYQKYLTVKYKLFNIVEAMPTLYKNTKGMSKQQLSKYLTDNKNEIEKLYGITDENIFITFVESLSFFSSDEIKSVSVRNSSIVYDVEKGTLMFNLVIFAGDDTIEYNVASDYYKVTDNQNAPYVTIQKMEIFD